MPTGAAGNLTVTDNAPVVLAQPTTLTATCSGLTAGLRYLGVINYAGATERTIVSIG